VLPTLRRHHDRGLREKERVCDAICAAQPNLLGSVLAQRSLGVSMPTIDVLLNFLIVLYLAIEEVWPGSGDHLGG
jgi:hypothetical protein